MKKLVNLIALVVLVSTNVFIPFSYAQVEISEVIPENEVETVAEILGETGENSEVSGEITELSLEEVGELEQQNQEDEITEGILPDIQDDIETHTIDGAEKDGLDGEVPMEKFSEIEVQDENIERDDNEESEELEKMVDLTVMEVVPGTSAILLPGKEFNVAIKELAGQSNVLYYTANTTIKQIIYTGTIPEGVTTTGLSISGSDYPVYAWFTGGILYYTTQVETIYLNLDSSFMFDNMQGLTGLDLSHFDTSNVENMSYMFYKCSGLININVSGWNTSNVTDMSSMFAGDYYQRCNLTNINVSGWDTSNVTNMSSMFQRCTKLTGLDVGSWDTSNVTNMSSMFNNCFKLTSLNVGSWDTSNVTNMGSMFAGSYYGNCSLTALDVGSWDTSNVTNMAEMFYYCRSLTGLDVSNWNTSNVTDMSSMFQRCGSLKTLNVSNWDTSSVTNMSTMFHSCGSLTGLNVSNWDTSNVTNMYYMFGYCKGLKSLDLSSWNTSKVASMGCMFYDCNLETIYASTGFVTTSSNGGYMFHGDKKLVGGNGTKFDDSVIDETYAKIDKPGQVGYFTDKNAINVKFLVDQDIYQTQTLSVGQKISRPQNPTKTGATFIGWIDSNGEEYDFDTMVKGYIELYAKFSGGDEAIFLQGKQFNEVIKKLGGNINQVVRAGSIPEGVTTTGISAPYSDKEIVAWFDSGVIYYYTDANTIYLNIDSSNMFSNCSSLTGLDMSGWNTSKVTNMSYMFYYCQNLTGLNVSNWDTSNVKIMTSMFYYCNKLKGLDLSNWNTSNVTNMRYMFYTCEGLNYLNLSGWDTSNVTDMGYMFYRNISLPELDVSHFNTSKVTNMTQMFLACTGLTHLDLSNFDTSNVTSMNSMFHSCSSLTGLNLSNFNTSKVTDMQYMFIYCYDLEELNLSGWDFRNLKYSISRLKDYLFRYTEGIKKLDLTNTAFSGQMRYFFEGMNSLEELKMGGADVSKVTDMSYMFEDCANLRMIDVNNWDTSNVTNMGGAFIRCKNLVEIKGLDTWDTSSMTVMQAMFYDCTGITQIDLSSFNTSKVTDMNSVFYNTPNLKTIYVSDKFVTNILSYNPTSMFYNSTSIIGGNGTKFDSGYIDKTYALIDKVGQTGYFTDKNAITVKFINTMDGTETLTTFAKGQKLTPPYVDKYHVVGGYLDEAMTQAIDLNKGVDAYSVIYVKYERNGSSGGGGGGGGSSTKPDTPKEDEKPSETPKDDSTVSSGTNVNDPENTTGSNVEIQTGSQVDSSKQAPQNDTQDINNSPAKASEGQSYSTEFQQAYQFAKGNGITTMPTIQKAQMNTPLTRIAMAKMLSQYAVNVLGKEPDLSKGVVKFNDVTNKMDKDYDDGVTLAYQLGIMGQNMPGNKFRPNDEVTRAEFATALSRLLYSTSDGKYQSTSKYYEPHMQKLKQEGIITNTDPKMKELRGYVMIMLMRSAK